MKNDFKRPNLFLNNLLPAIRILAALSMAQASTIQKEGYDGWVEKSTRYWGSSEEATAIAEHLDGMASELAIQLIEVEYIEGKIVVRSPDNEQLKLALATLEEETLLEPSLPRSATLSPA